jgi:biotin synthase-related radical SAM superfamily protein
LEYLINGIVDIYYYRDDNGEHYLVDNGSGDLLELKNEEKEIIIDQYQISQRVKGIYWNIESYI